MPEAGPGEYLSRGYQGAVYLRGTGPGRVVVKQAMGGPLARLLRRAMLRREHVAYQRLANVPMVPRCLGLEPDGSLLLEYRPGDAYRENLPALRDRQAFFEALLAGILALHAAGVAHADLKRRGNILVSADGQPILLDFGSAVLRPPGNRGLGGLLFRQACRMDLNAWIKLKYRRHYELVTPQDRRYYQPTFIEGAARVLRKGWRKVTGRQFRKAWRRRHGRR